MARALAAGAPAAGRSGAMLAGAVGNVLEWYDFAVYGYFAAIFARNFFPSEDHVASLLAAYGVFAAAFLTRPLGSLVFGHIGDRIGRKRALAVSVTAMALSTFCIGLLPTHAAIGVAAPALLIAMRLAQGLSVGGELTTSITYLGEESAPGRRGLNASWSFFGATLGTVLGSLSSALLETLLGPDGVAAWGWRVPFLGGIALGAVSVWLRRSFIADDVRAPTRAGRPPVAEAFATERRGMILAFMISTLVGVGFYMGFIYLTAFVQRYDSISAAEASYITMTSSLVLLALIPAFALLSDRVGRRPVMLAAAAAFALLAWPIFWLLTHGETSLVLVGQVLFAVMLAAYQGPLPAALTELFPRRVRCSATSVSYNLALGLLGGTTPMISVFLIARTDYPRAPAWYLIAAALVSLVGVWLSPERAGQALDRDGDPSPSGA